ncbi:MAG: hypothetical protein ACREOO_22440 [bacterium]
MGRGGSRVAVHHSKVADYRTVAESFCNGAEVAAEFGYWNAAAILQVHAAIALADAIAIKLSGVRSRGENHYETITLLDEVVAPGQDKEKALRQLRAIIDQKNWVSYSGKIFSRRDVDKLAKLLDRFRNWALKILTD